MEDHLVTGQKGHCTIVVSHLFSRFRTDATTKAANHLHHETYDNGYLTRNCCVEDRSYDLPNHNTARQDTTSYEDRKEFSGEYMMMAVNDFIARLLEHPSCFSASLLH